jgi:hypothetical protein
VTLRLDDKPTLLSPLDEWPLPAIPPFVEPSAQIWLTRDLRRYIEGRVLGRSYLIAGHRGAGKSALVGRVIDLVRTEIMRASVRAEGADLISDRPFQRPLLVKLHGPSMLDPHPAPVSSQGGGDAQAAANADDKYRPAAPTAGVHAALTQIGIGLYRALAAEAATGFRAHARLKGQPRPGDSRELAAQLPLDLDVGVTPARLRDYWLRVGRLRHGVLWPKSADATLDACRMDDQGLREIAAIATASQAFEVCSGRVTYGTTRKDKDVENQTVDTKGATDARKLLDQLGTLGVGAIAGAAVLGTGNGGIAAIGAGALTWLFGSLTISWSRTRTRNDDLTVDYSFIRDRDPATLDRDLPLVITRLREVGLAPVFVVDELDKVGDAADKIVGLVGSLKHLIADFGFFCFLVDRPCFDEFQRRIDAGGYPLEHTVFSDRVLLTPEPGPLYRYLLDRIVADSGVNTLPARSVFALATMHDARMNLTEVMRQLNHAQKADGSVGEVSDLLLQRRQVIATVQIAIDELLASAPLVDRIKARSGFAQLAVDALYYPSFHWSRGEPKIDASRTALQTYLERRVRERASLGDAVEPDVSQTPAIANGDLSLLHEALVTLLESLSKLEKVRAKAHERRMMPSDSTAPIGDDPRLSDIVPLECDAIVKRENGTEFIFLFDHLGEPIGVGTGRLSEAQLARAEELIEYAAAFEDALGAFNVTIDEIVETPLLSGLSGMSVNKAREELKIAVALGSSEGDTLQHLLTLERLLAEVRRSRASLAYLLALASAVSQASKRQTGVLPMIRRLLPLSKQPTQWLEGFTEKFAPLPLDAKALRKWCDALLATPVPRVGKNIPSPDDYDRFATVFERFVAGRPTTFKFNFDDLVMAALDLMPYRALANDLGTMTALDWSAVALAALPTGTGSPAAAPYWILSAALRILGFGAPGLTELIDAEALGELKKTGFIVETSMLTSEAIIALAGKFVISAPVRPTGIVVIDTDEEAYGRAQPSATRPSLLVHAAILDDYAQALNWLEGNGILTIGADARPPGDEK